MQHVASHTSPASPGDRSTGHPARRSWDDSLTCPLGAEMPATRRHSHGTPLCCAPWGPRCRPPSTTVTRRQLLMRRRCDALVDVCCAHSESEPSMTRPQVVNSYPGNDDGRWMHLALEPAKRPRVYCGLQAATAGCRCKSRAAAVCAILPCDPDVPLARCESSSVSLRNARIFLEFLLHLGPICSEPRARAVPADPLRHGLSLLVGFVRRR